MWSFQRDEFHLLEEELEEIFRQKSRSSDPEIARMEEDVIEEQMRTEERFDKAVAGDMMQGQDLPLFQEDVHELLFHHGSLRDVLSAGQIQDPMYRSALHLAVRLSRWARETYYRRRQCERDVFRVLINANVIPMKISFALSELELGGAEASMLAKQEYALAHLYLGRVLESLQALRLRHGEWLFLRTALHRAGLLQEQIRLRLQQI